MHLSLNMIHRTDDGVLVAAPHGEVLLKRTAEGTTANYLRGPLVNDSARAYAREVQDEAFHTVSQYDLAWEITEHGHIQVKDQARFYEESFQPELFGAETLIRWSCLAE